MSDEQFITVLQQKGQELYRDMPWRRDTRAYYVLVSELMLQQTQVARVIPKFNEFIAKFPNEQTLAAASLGDVVKLWQGLGYNRRAKYLHDAAKMIMRDFHAAMPRDHDQLLTLPGVGTNTAGAIMAYAYNVPAIFVETNIRTVYIHHFFADDSAIDDKAIIAKLQTTIDTNHPRQFYQALMDYGTTLKAQGVRNTMRSKHYKKQSRLEGSVRQVRGQIIAALAVTPLPYVQLAKQLSTDERFDQAYSGLVRDGLIEVNDAVVQLTK